MESHLLQMRGLKLEKYETYLGKAVSHLLQMRGLKLRSIFLIKNITLSHLFTDAWIETYEFNKRV